MPEERLKSALHKLLGDRIAWAVPTAQLTSLGVGGPAWAVARPADPGELADLLALLAEYQTPYTLIGQGSNFLFADEGYAGLLIKLGPDFKGFDFMPGDRVMVRAATMGLALVEATRKYSLSGLECLSGIPCTLGGALAMNAGCGGAAIGDVLTELFYMGPDGERVTARKEDLDFAYRRLGGLPKGAVIVAAVMQLAKIPAQDFEARFSEMAAKRKKSQPQGVRSAGCFFKNPPGDSAGRLIDQCGLKGFRIGGALVSDVHANFLINSGAATAKDFLALRDMIMERVQKEFGLLLETEVKIIGG